MDYETASGILMRGEVLLLEHSPDGDYWSIGGRAVLPITAHDLIERLDLVCGDDLFRGSEQAQTWRRDFEFVRARSGLAAKPATD